jgi:23S rRNA (cytosine1962-C5)-methyltransferase
VAAASCSSHLRESKFLEIIEKAVSQQRRKATLLGVYGQPPDHPAPLAMEELRYLKFVPFRLD